MRNSPVFSFFAARNFVDNLSLAPTRSSPQRHGRMGAAEHSVELRGACARASALLLCGRLPATARTLCTIAARGGDGQRMAPRCAVSQRGKFPMWLMPNMPTRLPQLECRRAIGEDTWLTLFMNLRSRPRLTRCGN